MMNNRSEMTLLLVRSSFYIWIFEILKCNPIQNKVQNLHFKNNWRFSLTVYLQSNLWKIEKYDKITDNMKSIIKRQLTLRQKRVSAMSTITLKFQRNSPKVLVFLNSLHILIFHHSRAFFISISWHHYVTMI